MVTVKMKTKRLPLILLILTLFALVGTTVHAQTYAFSLDRETVDVFWESDGTLSLQYVFVFSNAGYADPLDFVDVGMPNSHYSLSTASGTIDGNPITHIASSPYVTNGIELGLAPHAIQPGQTGTVVFSISGVRNVLYQDSDDDAYASAVFSPTWFDSDFVTGSTDLTITYHFPPDLTSEEPRWHQAPSGFPSQPVTGFDDQGRITYTWRNSIANGYTQYLFGASFPKTYVPPGVIQTPSFWETLGIDFEALIGTACMCLFGLMFLGIPILSIRNANKRKMKYLPPKLAIEGHGIKRGLTAIEAAVLLEQPMDKILTMILFSTIKKDAATVISRDPLKIEVADPLPEGLREYEKEFLAAMAETSAARQKKSLQTAMISLVQAVAKAMKGFSQRETRTYYKQITEAAWKQVEDADTPEVKSQAYDKVMEWTMLDEDYDDRTRRVFHGGPVFIPHWYPRYSPTRTGGTSMPQKTGAPASRSTPGGTSMPQLPGSEFAGSIVTGAQDFATGVIGSVPAFTSSVTEKTNPIPRTSSSSSGRSGGGSSCACACACAGCACACAGGGR
jgi:hypothetical protein